MRLLLIASLPVTLATHLSPPAAFTTLSTTSTASICPYITPIAQLPFLSPNLFIPDDNNENQHSDAHDPLHALLSLARRQNSVTTSTGTCPTGYFGCSNLGAPQACCSTTAICTTDSVNHVACCASGATCTGTIGGSGSGGGSSAATSGGSTSSTSTSTSSSGSNGGTAVSSSGVVIVTAGAPVTSHAIGREGAGPRWVTGIVSAVVLLLVL